MKPHVHKYYVWIDKIKEKEKKRKSYLLFGLSKVGEKERRMKKNKRKTCNFFFIFFPPKSVRK